MKKVNYQVKRNRFGSLIILVPIILAGIAEILAIVSSRSSATYAISDLSTVEILTEVSIAILIVAYVLSFHIRGKIFGIVFDVLRVAAVAMLCACFYIVLDTRADLMGFIWFSDLEKGNTSAEAALSYGVASGVLYVVAIVFLAISGAVEFVNAGATKRSREEVESEIRELQAELATIDENA